MRTSHVQYTNKRCDVHYTLVVLRKYVRETQQSCDNIVKSFEALHIKGDSAVIYLMLFYHALMFVRSVLFRSQCFYHIDVIVFLCVSTYIVTFRYLLIELPTEGLLRYGPY